MAASMRNMTFMSSSFTKCLHRTKCGRVPLFYVFPKQHHSGPVLRSVVCHRQSILRQRKHLQTLLAARYASTGGSDLPPGYIPDIPLAPMDITTLLPELNAIGEPTLQSMGLAANTPPGLIQQLLEILHVSVDIPWWAAIALAAVSIRTVLFPLMIYQRRTAIHFRNHMPTVTRLQQKMSDAKNVGNNMEMETRLHELRDYMKRNDVKYRRMLVMPIVQVPILISMYQAIRNMSGLPVESMKTGGLGWFVDLTIADPYYILPAVTAISMLAMLELGTESQKTKDMSHGLKWFMRCMPLAVFGFTSHFASGIAFYWTVNNLISLITVQFLNQSSVKALFKIPQEVVHKKEARERKGFKEGFMDIYHNSKLASESTQRRNIDDMAFKKAGVGPVPKTYRYNPKEHEETINVETFEQERLKRRSSR